MSRTPGLAGGPGAGLSAPQEAALALRSARFRAEREADWQRLEALVAKTEARGTRALGFEEARDLAGLYAQAATALSVARSISLDRALLDYLEALVARAYLAVYAPQESLGGLLGRFLSRGAPRAMRRLAFFVALAFLCLGLGGLAGYALYLEDAGWYDLLMPPSLAGGRHPGASTEDLRAAIYGGGEQGLDALGAFAAFLFSHNTRIAIFAFALGAFAGLPTVLLIFYNGLILGAFVALHVERGLGLDILAWLSVHGVTELSAIAIAAGGGLALGAAVVSPGRHRRADALRLVGRDATKLALVAGLMLLAAALLEGFGRQLITDPGLRLAVGWGVGLLWLAWFARGGRT